MTADRFEQDLRIVLREDLPGEAPLALRLRVARIAQEAVDVRPATVSFRPRRLAWILLATAAMLAALAAGALLIASRPDDLSRHPEPLVATGITALTPADLVYPGLVADVDGALWMIGEGPLVRFDPVTGTARTWTAADDAAFASGPIRMAPAREGGVWLVSDQIRWFDGVGFRDVIEAPEGASYIHEAPDGSLWVATGWPDRDTGDLLHWDGTSWNRLEGPRPGEEIDVISVDAEGRVWAGVGEGWIARYDGSSWTTAALDGRAAGWGVVAIEPLPDGTARVVTEDGLGVFDGSAWTLTAPAPRWLHPGAAFGPDGDVWAAGGGWIKPPSFAYRFDGRSWVEYPGLGRGVASGVVATKGGVYVLVGDVIKALSGERWEQAWTPGAATSPEAGPFTALQPISRDELWAATQDAIWHFADGTWTRDRSVLPDGRVNGLALAPDGTLWAAGSDGVSQRRDGTWATVDPTSATAVTVDPHGTVWAGGGSSVWGLRRDGPDWTPQALPGYPLPSVTSLAVDGRGVLWAGGQGRLARYDGSGWAQVREIDGSVLHGASVLGMARDGKVRLEAWLDLAGRSPGDPWRPALASFDGSSWSVLEAPAGTCGLATGADGTVWASTQQGPAVRDGEGWSFPFSSPVLRCARHGESQSTEGIPQVSVASDGTPFVNHAAGIWSFAPVLTPSP